MGQFMNCIFSMKNANYQVRRFYSVGKNEMSNLKNKFSEGLA
jgi:hypothetical protein